MTGVSARTRPTGSGSPGIRTHPARLLPAGAGFPTITLANQAGRHLTMTHVDDSAARRGPRRHETVWLYPRLDPALDNGPAASWLLAAVERLLTRTTLPGESVLLLSDPATPGAFGDREELAAVTRVVRRLARAVHIRTAIPFHPDAAGSETGPRRGPDADRAGGGPEPAPTSTSDPDESSLILVAIPPAATADVDLAALAGLLAPTGILAILTHQDHRGGVLLDPTGALTLAAGAAGLAPVDRIVVVQIPLEETVRPASPLPASAVGARVHCDLLLFTPTVRLREARDGEPRW